MDCREVNVFWTSGLDSTFRIVELAASEGHIIQPWYIIDEKRRSSRIEMKRIRKMTHLIRENKATKSELKDLKVVNLADVVIPDKISAIYPEIREKYSLGNQYIWLSAFLESAGLEVEVAAELPHTGISSALLGECEMELEGDGADACFRVEPESSSEAGKLLFSRMLFPHHIWTIYKQDEMNEMIALGYEDVFKLTWFCHRPVFGMPCGHCHPCKDVIRDGLGWRIPTAGKLLYPVVRLFRHAFHRS